jgi:deoxyribonuclease-1-like protein
MKKLFSLASTALALALGWYVLQSASGGKFPSIPFLVPGTPAGRTLTDPPVRNVDSIRVASFNIQVFGEQKINNPNVMPIIVEILRSFDVIAIQEIRAQQDILPRLIEMLNADGRYHYDYVIGPRLGRSNSKEQYAFVFDRATIEVDRAQLSTLDDPDDLLHREPLVGWFRARAGEPAFTFSLVNIHTDPDEVDRELDVLDDVFYAVRDDSRHEDDVIMLGDFNANDTHLNQLGQIPGLVRVVMNAPTNTRGTAQYDNILFHQTATTEFTARGGVFDFLRHYNLSLEQALAVSDHLPVWAEFSVYEGGQGPRLVTRPDSSAPATPGATREY